MIGRGGSNLQQIMAKTGASICFPDPNSGLASGKGGILISGTIDNILAARESIIVSRLNARYLRFLVYLALTIRFRPQ